MRRGGGTILLPSPAADMTRAFMPAAENAEGWREIDFFNGVTENEPAVMEFSGIPEIFSEWYDLSSGKSSLVCMGASGGSEKWSSGAYAVFYTEYEGFDPSSEITFGMEILNLTDDENITTDTIGSFYIEELTENGALLRIIIPYVIEEGDILSIDGEGFFEVYPREYGYPQNLPFEEIREKSRETTVESTEDVTEEPTPESTEEVTEEPALESTEDVTEEPALESTEEVTEETTVESTEEVTEETTLESTGEPAGEDDRYIFRESPEDDTLEPENGGE